jgi:katanin p60 ATPase-containing subunit A1
LPVDAECALSRRFEKQALTAAFTGGDPKLVEAIEAEMLDRSPSVPMESIGGLADAKRLLNEAVVLPLLIPDYFAAAACRSAWKGVLLFGPPGTGKTLLAKAVASLGKTAFFNISASSLVSKYHGESEKLVRTLFALARHHAPSVVFFDEVDAILSTRGAVGEHEASRRLKSELLMQMDGLSSSGAAAASTPDCGSSSSSDSLVMVLATSNKPWDLDEAMRRRLERRIYVPLPDEEARREMLQIHLKGVTLAAEVDLDGLARRTEGYSGADLQLLCRDASMTPMRRMVEGKSPSEIIELQAAGALEGEVSAEDFDAACARTLPSTNAAEQQVYVSWNDEFGCK